MFILPAAVHRLAQFGFVSIWSRKPVGIARHLCFLGEASALSVWAERGWRRRQKGHFPNYAATLLHYFHSPGLLQLLLPNNTLSSVATYWCPFSPLWSPHPACTSTPTPSLLFQIASSSAICSPGGVFSHLLSGLGLGFVFFFSPGWVAPFWNWVGVLAAWWDPQQESWSEGFSMRHSHKSPAHAAWAAAGRILRLIPRPPCKPRSPPATSECQLILPVTQLRGFFFLIKGKCLVFPKRKKLSPHCESEPQDGPCPGRCLRGALPGRGTDSQAACGGLLSL